MILRLLNVSRQLKPLQNTLANLQQQNLQHEATIAQQNQYWTDRLQRLEDSFRSERRVKSEQADIQPNLIGRIESIVESVLNDKGVGKLDQLSVDISLSKNNEYILQVRLIY